ncbi:amino acid-binding ACT [Paraglaciecola sp. T6c]|uniref:glycine cleavage system protein R n=1 Tax=Pseudoalteromonas atlantica (strain T6c / ATCC BAA-1087) TaxID=3042615 RepID=UPI00005C74B3|nr:ACT domain-containing protein [Paraglaciecola sp. T6c]ABG41827.1 amino acid-binding ACT [Paraglaciecola sp. T6c]
MKSLIFTLVGKDKRGLVDSLAQSVFKLGGNWLGSNLSYMAGHFAGFVEIQLPEEKKAALIEQFSTHPDLSINLVEGDNNLAAHTQTVQIDIMGNDKPGIVQELTTILNRFNLNIVKFDSTCDSAPNWGGLLFKANALVAIEEGFDLDELSDALESIADDLVVDISSTPTK